MSLAVINLWTVPPYNSGNTGIPAGTNISSKWVDISDYVKVIAVIAGTDAPGTLYLEQSNDQATVINANSIAYTSLEQITANAVAKYARVRAVTGSSVTNAGVLSLDGVAASFQNMGNADATTLTGELFDTGGAVFNVKAYGAKGDAITRTDGATTAGSTTLTSASGTFASTDVGKDIGVTNAASNATLTAALVSGTAYTSLAVTPLTTAIASGANVVLLSGINTQTFVTTSSAAIGATSLAVTSLAANAAYPIGTFIDPVSLFTKIVSVQSATQITMEAAATISSSGMTYVYGTDDTANVQDAINSCSVAGGTVLFPPGIYLINPSGTAGSALSVFEGNPIVVQGSGRNTTTLILANTTKALFTVSADYTVVQDLGFDTQTFNCQNAFGVTCNNTLLLRCKVISGSNTVAIFYPGTGALGSGYNYGNQVIDLELNDQFNGDGFSFSQQSGGLVENIRHTGSRIDIYWCEYVTVRDYFFTQAGIPQHTEYGWQITTSNNITIDNFVGYAAALPPSSMGNLATNASNNEKCNNITLTNHYYEPTTGVYAAWLGQSDVDGLYISNCYVPTMRLYIGNTVALKNVIIKDSILIQFQTNMPSPIVSDVIISNCIFLPFTPISGQSPNPIVLQGTATHNLNIIGGRTDNTNGLFNGNQYYSSRVSQLRGYNPTGPQTAPTVPASGTSLINPFPFDATVYVSGGTVTAITSGNIATPSGLALTTATTGGTLAASTAYEYQVTAVNQVGETLACTAVSLTTGSTTSTNTITATWQPVTGATSYNIYGRVSGSIAKIANVTSPTYTDTGSVAPSGALPTSDTTGTSTGLTSGQFFIPAGEGLQLTYSAAPTWVWIGN